jgi:hypothetical protein
VDIQARLKAAFRLPDDPLARSVPSVRRSVFSLTGDGSAERRVLRAPLSLSKRLEALRDTNPPLRSTQRL